MTSGWLLRGGEVLAACECAEGLWDRSRGLLGRAGYDGALLLPHTRAVHTLGMRFPVDVAFLDRELTVVATSHLRPWRLGLPRRGARLVLEAEGGAFERWQLRPGDRLELHAP